jgi:hypothetical protein
MKKTSPKTQKELAERFDAGEELERLDSIRRRLRLKNR